MLFTPGTTYKMTFPNGDVTTTVFNQLVKYPSTGMPDDFLFEYICGDDRLSKSSPLSPHFVLPATLLKLTTIVEV